MNSLAELPSEVQCHRRIYKIVWGDYTCPNGCGTKVRFRSKYEYCSHCKQKFSVKAETFFKYTKLPYRSIYALIYCWQGKCSIGETKRLLRLSYPTIRRWMRRFRKILPKCDGKISGGLEADESFFGKRKYGRQTIVMGVIEPNKQQVRLGIIPDRGRQAIEGFIRENVEPGSGVVSDGCTSYNELPALGYAWDSCNHEQGQFGPTNHIEGVWSVIKRHLRHLYRDLSFSLEDLRLILKEWEARYNFRELFYTVDSYLEVTVCSGLVH